jgi:hypothetical protein
LKNNKFQTKQVVCFLFLPAVFMGLDALIPLIVRLKKENWKIYTIIRSSSLIHFLNSTPSYHLILKENSTILKLNSTQEGHYISKKPKILKGLMVILKILFTSKPRIITAEVFDPLFFKLLRCMVSWKGMFYTVSRCPAPYRGYYKDYFVDSLNNPEKRKILNKKPGGYKTYTKKNYCGTYLIHSEFETDNSNIVGFPAKRLKIGYPKFLKSWHEYLEKYEVAWDSEKLKNTDSIIAVLFPLPDIIMFDRHDSVEVFLKEIIQTVRKYYKNELIVLKQKPYVHKNRNQWVEDFISQLNDYHIVLTSMPTPFLAMKAMLEFMIGDSTSCFDFIIREVPCIQHNRYSVGWRKIYPRGDWWGDIGVRKTDTIEELDSAIREVREGKFKPMDINNLKKKIGHYDNDDVFRIL